MTMTTGNFAKATYPEPITSWIGMGEKMERDYVPELFNVMSSDQSIEEMTIIYGLGQMELSGEGQSIPYADGSLGPTLQVTHSDYALGFQVSQNLIDDGKAMRFLERYTKALGKAYTDSRNTTAMNFIENAFSSSVSADGATLISSAHPGVGIANQSNLLSTDAALSEAAVQQAVTDLASITDDRGLRIDINFTKLVVPKDLHFEASRLLNSAQQPGTSNNDVNPIMKEGIFPGGFLVVPRFSDTTAWYALTNYNTDEGLVFFDRMKLKVDSAPDFDTRTTKVKSYARWSHACGDWKAIFGSNGV